jgi:hypothetical protein
MNVTNGHLMRNSPAISPGRIALVGCVEESLAPPSGISEAKRANACPVNVTPVDLVVHPAGK